MLILSYGMLETSLFPVGEPAKFVFRDMAKT